MLFTPLLTLVLLTAQPLTEPDTLVVCPPSLRTALRPWIEFRTAQGHGIVVCDPPTSSGEVRAWQKGAGCKASLKNILLVGDVAEPVDGPVAGRAAAGQTIVPTRLAPAKVNVRWGSEPELATDNAYADLDGDQIPDVAVGRLTAHSSAELAALVNKIIAYERGLDGGAWQRQLNFVAGASGAGTLVDTALESLTRSILCELIPAAYRTTMTYGRWQSPYCPHPTLFRDCVMERLNEGCLFWVYLGHGQRRFLDYVRAPEGNYPVLHGRDAAQLHAASARPIVLLMACYTGAFDAPEDCLAEELLRAEGGPVAVIASSRVTMPYGMGVLGLELLGEFFGDRPATIGQLLLAAKRHALERPRTDARSKMLDALASTLNPEQTDLAAERLEHVLLFNLLGDPLVSLPRPLTATVAVSGTLSPGGELAISGTSPIDGTAQVELVVRRDRLTFEPPPRKQYERSPEAGREYTEIYARANDARLAATRTEVRGGAFQARLTVPQQASGACHVRVFVEGATACALGAADLAIGMPKTNRTEAATRTENLRR